MSTKHDVVDRISLNHQVKENYLFKNSSITDSNLDDLKLNIIYLKTGEILFRLGDSADSIFLIIEGEINLIKKQSFGKTHSCLSQNNFFGHEEYFLGTERNSLAIALKDSSIVEISKENIELLIIHNNSILKNIKDSLLDLDSKSISKFESIIHEVHNYAEKQTAEFSIEAEISNSTKPGLGSSSERLLESNIPVYDKVESVINRIIKNINHDLSLLEEEKNRMRFAVSDYENNNQKLRNEIEELKEQESRTNNLDKEKNEILVGQSYRIVKLEKEYEKFKELEAEYLKKTELFAEQILKDKNRIKEIEAELKENKKTLSELKGNNLLHAQEAENQDRLLKEQRTELKSLEQKIKNLTLEFSAKEISLTELQQELQKKNQLISLQNASVSKAKDETENLKIKLENKEVLTKNLSARIGELQNKLDNQTESEKNKNEFILNQSNKISEYEKLLKNYEKDISEKVETLNNFADEISKLSESVRQKESEIHELNKTVLELNSITKYAQETSELLETKIKENSNLQKNIAELKNTLKNKNNIVNDLDNAIAQLRIELSHNAETIDNSTRKISQLSENVSKKESEIHEQIKKTSELNLSLQGAQDKISLLERKLKENSDVQKDLVELKNELKNKNSRINDLDALTTQLRIDLAQRLETINNYGKEISELSEKLKQKEFEFFEQDEKIGELSSLTQDVKNISSLLENKANENSEIRKELEELKKTRQDKDNKINDLDNLIASLRIELSSSNNLQNEYNSLKAENRNLSERVIKLTRHIDEDKNENDNLLKANHEIDRLRSEEEKYKNRIIEKENLIKELTARFEGLELTKSEEIKTLASAKSNYEEELNKKNIQITKLMDQIKDIQSTIEEKSILEDQQTAIIENQVQKIAQLEILINDSQVKSNSPNITKAEPVLKVDSPPVGSKEKVQPKENYEIFSKSKLIKSKPVDTSIPDEGFEYYQHFDLHIVNVNVTRATMDVVTPFNELLQKIISKEKNKIIVSLLDCEFIDSSILGVLVSTLKKVTAMGGDLRLVGFHPIVRSMMELTRVNRIFESFPTVEAAVTSFDV